MGLAYKAVATTSSYGSGNVTTDSGIAVAVGDLVVASITSNDSSVDAAGFTDSVGNSYTLRDVVDAGNSSSQRLAYCIATKAGASVTFTASFGAGSSTKAINLVTFLPDSGDTVSLEIGLTGSSSWVESPWSTSSDDTVSTDAVAVAFFFCGAAKTYSDEEIPENTAATVLTPANTGSTYFYRILTAGVTGIEAITVTNGNGSFAGELLVFQSVGGGAATAPTGSLGGCLIGSLGGPF